MHGFSRFFGLFGALPAKGATLISSIRLQRERHAQR